MLLLRRPRTWWSLPAALIMWAACTSIGHLWLDLVTLVFCIGLVFVEAVLYPAWIRADARGVTIWNSFRRRVFRWSEIERFEVGNPAHPVIAYLLRKRNNDIVPIELPDLVDPAPSAVVHLLSTRHKALHQRQATHAI